jgi:hypothetical protein
MRRWTFWEWVAYAGMNVAATILAIDTGFKLSPNLTPPAFLHSAWWGFAPALLITFSTIIFLLRAFAFSGRGASSVTAETARLLDRKGADEKRVFIADTMTPKKLTELFEDHTAIQAHELVKPFVRKWIKLNGLVRDVQKHLSMSILMLEKGGDLQERLDNPAVVMQFENDWTDRLAMLRRGDNFTVIGKISLVDRLSVALEHS